MSVLFGCVIFPSTAEVTVDDFTSEELDSSVYDIEKYTKPFWEGNIVYNEVVFPIKNAQGEIEPFELMYDASEIVSVKSYTHDVTYTENVDYVLQDGNLVILPTGRISVADYEYIHRPSVPAGYGSSEIYPYYLRLDGNGDGTIMTNDLVILKRVISGVSLNFNSASSDVNGDGQITAADVAILTRIISGAVM